jgi:hypothetical protein
MEAMRAPRRRLSDAVYRQLVTDAARRSHSMPAQQSPRSGTIAQSDERGDPAAPPAAHHDDAPKVSTWSAHWTNDVDTDQRRRTLDSFGTAHLTNPVIDGSHDRTFPSCPAGSCTSFRPILYGARRPRLCPQSLWRRPDA